MHRLFLALGALAGLSAVAMAAWAAHGLPARLDAARLAQVQAALTMQGWHALALLAVAGLAERRVGGWPVAAAGAALAVGVALFCGAVYAGALAGVRAGPVAPLGGLALMAGWALLLVAAVLRRGPPRA